MRKPKVLQHDGEVVREQGNYFSLGGLRAAMKSSIFGTESDEKNGEAETDWSSGSLAAKGHKFLDYLMDKEGSEGNAALQDREDDNVFDPGTQHDVSIDSMLERNHRRRWTRRRTPKDKNHRRRWTRRRTPPVRRRRRRRVDCVFTDWSNAGWKKCTKNCGSGWKTISRSKRGPFYGGRPCFGPTTISARCNTDPCPIDCRWKGYGPWHRCTKACGGGSKFRFRGKYGPFYGGTPCSGPTFKQLACNQRACPVPCKWLQWESWSRCSRTCGKGEMSRWRGKLGPFHGGKPCFGRDTQWNRACNAHRCAIPCYWNQWTAFSACTLSCGFGNKRRHRSGVGPYHGGYPCVGSRTDEQACNIQPCPIDCKWGGFSKWTRCSKTCAGGTLYRYRHREVLDLHGGRPCNGQAEQYKDCNQQACPV